MIGPGLVVAAALASPAAQPPSQACAVAEVAVQEVGRRGGDPLLFSTGLPDRWGAMFPVHAGGPGLTTGPQSSAALARFDPDTLGPALTCANARQRAAALGDVVEEAAGQSRLRAMGLNGRTAYMWRIAMPVLDRSGKQAVVAAFASSNQLAGGSEILSLARQRDGSWKVTGRRILSMS